jgi:hypothetical protein
MAMPRDLAPDGAGGFVGVWYWAEKDRQYWTVSRVKPI